ncbi:hypothetical protein RD792_008913 [Penstemon davidsonii]|uniref:USP domain-containing protein n=1 Tax=Penstemon davidsonii TaxID=160366 RepID=A0ABR0DAG4_9LAMI|nr:hypothetical protein RD792_008913 [Penstemon davidsonii]
MHVAVDLNWFLQFIVFAVVAVFGLLYLVRNTASRYFMVDSNFDSSAVDFSLDRNYKRENMAAAAESIDSCAVCGLLTTKHCASCKMVKYWYAYFPSGACQRSHWNSEHKSKCKDLQSLYKANQTKSTYGLRGRKSSVVPLGGSSRIFKQSNKILFPYEEFVELFNWDKPGYPPCGLLNCGNSCFANVALQCLAYTRPLVAHLLEKGHRIECQRNDWCFLCEFQTHLERASRSRQPFSPINILSRLTSIGGNLGYGKQEDAHEFMRFAIDNMQSVCLDEFGGEKAVHHSYQETTLIQHIFGGRLQSQVICTECNNISSQFENMMDLTVEIHGDAGSLEECLDQFTVKEQLHGDNMYKCDGPLSRCCSCSCNAYVKAWKRLTVRRAPNILTIALKRFQSGRFGKLNKRVTFPETLDLSPYMSDLEDGNDVYKLYAVIVHVDMLNASFFGHYICYVKDFRGKWYRIDDCKVASVDLDEVLSQGAYMLLYSRICVRPTCLLPVESLRKNENGKLKIQEVDPSLNQPSECISDSGFLNSHVDPGQTSSSICSGLKVNSEEESSSISDAEDETEGIKLVSSEPILPSVKVGELQNGDGLSTAPKEEISPVKHTNHPNPENSEAASFISVVENTCLGSQIVANEGVFRNLAEESLAADDGTFEEGNNTCDVCPLAVTNGGVLDLVNDANSKSIPKNAKCENSSPSPDADNCTFKEGNNTCDVSPLAVTNGGVLDEVSDVNSTSMPKNANENCSPSPSDIQDAAARKSNGESSASKLKPLFAPGFLDKRPRKKSIVPGDKVYVEFSEVSPKIYLNNEAAKPLLCENGGFLEDEESPYGVRENGKVCSESYNICKSLENGDSGDDQFAISEGIKTNTNPMKGCKIGGN